MKVDSIFSKVKSKVIKSAKKAAYNGRYSGVPTSKITSNVKNFDIFHQGLATFQKGFHIPQKTSKIVALPFKKESHYDFKGDMC